MKDGSEEYQFFVINIISLIKCSTLVEGYILSDIVTCKI